MVGLLGQMSETEWFSLREGICKVEQSRSVGKKMANSAWTRNWSSELEVSIGP